MLSSAMIGGRRGALRLVIVFSIVLLLLLLFYSSFAPHIHSQLVNQIQKMPQSDQKYHGMDEIVEVDDSELQRLKKKVRVLVWVMTSPISLDRAKAVNQTWGSRADKGLLFYMSSEKNASLHMPIVALPMKEGRDHLTAKTMLAFDYVYKHYFHEADFFMKADDDCYVIMENLRYFLSHLDPNQPFVTGRHFRRKVKQGFPSGGAGYVLSKAALARLATRPKDPPLCKEDGPEEDVELARCLERLGVPILNSTDVRGRSRFHAYPPMKHVVTGLGKNYQYWDANIVRIGPDAIHEFPITFHYVQPREMKLLHFLLYNIRPYGINYKFSKS